MNTTIDLGKCLISSTDSQTLVSTFKQKIYAGSWYRISATIKNPDFYNSNGGTVQVFISSRAESTYFHYEYKTNLDAQFNLTQYNIADMAVMYFWGLNKDDSVANSTSGWGCPISIYKTSGGSA